MRTKPEAVTLTSVYGEVPKYLQRSHYKKELERQKRQELADKVGLIVGYALVGLSVAYFSLHFLGYVLYISKI